MMHGRKNIKERSCYYILEYKSWLISAQCNTSGAVDWLRSLDFKFMNIWKENMGDEKPMSDFCHVLNNKRYSRPNVFLRNLEPGLNRSQSMIRKRREMFVACWLRFLTKLSMSKVMSSVVDEWMDMDHWWNDRERGEPRQFKRKFSHCNFYDHKSHGLAWDWTPSSVMTGRNITVWAMTSNFWF